MDLKVEGRGDKLELWFEQGEQARFVISPNSAVRQIWISALTSSFQRIGRNQASRSCFRGRARACPS